MLYFLSLSQEISLWSPARWQRNFSENIKKNFILAGSAFGSKKGKWLMLTLTY
jgi:hypothetical protein